MMRHTLAFGWCCVAMLSVLCCDVAAALANDDAPPADAKDMLLKMGLELDAKKREVRLAATVCLDRGILEYFICLSGRDQTFEHESAFSTACTPSVLHLALLAIGAEPCEYEGPLNWEKAWSQKPASRLRLRIEYVQDGKRVLCDASEVLASRSNKEGKLPEFWIFTGSYFGERSGKSVYAADAYGGIAGFCQDDASVLQTGKSYGNPYDGSEAGLEINPKKIPPRGTKVTLLFSPYMESDPQDKKADK